MRVLVFHGYLLGGTGSNVYNARLAAALRQLGHDVELLTQERHPHQLDFVDAVGAWEDGVARVEVLRRPVRVTAWRPDIGDLLPVYVPDRYEGLQARPYADCSDEEVAAYVAANVAAVRDVVARTRPEVALANHLVMGPLILARALGGEVPYAVKVHGSALEYTVKPHPERFLPAAREGLAGAATVLVGSRHTAESLWAALDDPALPARTRLGPPGVDVEEFRPRPAGEAAADVRALARRLQGEAAPVGGQAAARSDPGRGEPTAGGEPVRGRSAAPRALAGAQPAVPTEAPSAFARDEAAAGRALAALDLDGDPHVAFVGKLIVSKGIDLLAAAWPLVLAEVPAARLVIVGFGGWREALERLLAALQAGDLDTARAIAAAGRAGEGGPRAPLRHLLAFLGGLDGERLAAYRTAAAGLDERVVLTGRLEHEELAPLLAACEAQVVPSTFPEAFGMVAAEAAACGALPLSAAHSGLAEVTEALAAEVPPPARGWLSFEVGDGAVEAIAERLVAWLQAPADLRAATRHALVATARRRYSWLGVAEGVIAAAEGRHDALRPPA